MLLIWELICYIPVCQLGHTLPRLKFHFLECSLHFPVESTERFHLNSDHSLVNTKFFSEHQDVMLMKRIAILFR